MVAIINYGMGNLRSVANAVSAQGAAFVIATRPTDLNGASKIILPGVGSFGDGIRNLRNEGWIDALEQQVRQEGKPFLGICLGMQLLASEGTEDGVHAGLNWIEGRVERILPSDSTMRVPHVGWNDVAFVKPANLYADMGDKQAFYFTHSYVFHPYDSEVVTGVCSYGTEFVASVEKNNIHAVQYHLEKSHKCGLKVLKNFLEIE